MNIGPTTATVMVVNPFDTNYAPWPRFRYGPAAQTATIEIQAAEQATAVVDKRSMEPSSAAIPHVFESPELVTTVNRIEAFEQEELQEDRPSPVAFRTTMSVLKQAAQFLKGEFPRGSTSVGVGQGLRVTWRLPKGEVRLIIDGVEASKNYIYVEPREIDSYIEKTVSGDKLAAAILNVLS